MKRPNALLERMVDLVALIGSLGPPSTHEIADKRRWPFPSTNSYYLVWKYRQRSIIFNGYAMQLWKGGSQVGFTVIAHRQTWLMPGEWRKADLRNWLHGGLVPDWISK